MYIHYYYYLRLPLSELLDMVVCQECISFEQDDSHLPFTMVSSGLHVGSGGHEGSSGVLVQSTGGHDMPIIAD